jgi:hypothetical protein
MMAFAVVDDKYKTTKNSSRRELFCCPEAREAQETIKKSIRLERAESNKESRELFPKIAC